MNNQTVLVKFRGQYGRMVCHPVNEQAKVFAQIAGTRTLTWHTLKGIDYLGFTIATTSETHRVTLQILSFNEVRELLGGVTSLQLEEWQRRIDSK
jgi:hypothetical protein